MFEKAGDDELEKSAGSPAFMAPELCAGKTKGARGKVADIWSLGECDVSILIS